ncbi:dipeptide epimerase [Halobacteriales archaeon QS_9_70_65]|nr:MAG: dipeptide epimerase [Halobacteriales archaeon QS_9_70_65]
MNWRAERVELPLSVPFTIARGTTTVTENVVVTVEHGGETGHGAAAPAARYGETADTVEAVLPALFEAAEAVGDVHARRAIADRMRGVVRDNPAARAAVDVALWDLAGKLLDEPVFRLLGLSAAPDRRPATSYTVGIAETATMKRRAREAADAGYPVLKLKLGSDRDRRGLRYVHERSPLPIAADESCRTADDVAAVADRCDIANLKLMKTGGITPAVEAIHVARAHGLAVMCGCMLETDAAIAGAAQLLPLLDYADLDGSLLLETDPYAGVPVREGQFGLGDVEAGTGAAPR